MGPTDVVAADVVDDDAAEAGALGHQHLLGGRAVVCAAQNHEEVRLSGVGRRQNLQWGAAVLRHAGQEVALRPPAGSVTAASEHTRDRQTILSDCLTDQPTLLTRWLSRTHASWYVNVSSYAKS